MADIVTAYLDRSTARTWRLAIPGSNHRDFTLMGFLSPLAKTLGLGLDFGGEHFGRRRCRTGIHARRRFAAQ